MGIMGMKPRERAEQLWETWKKATFVVSTQTIHAENYIRMAEQAINAAVEDAINEKIEECAQLADKLSGEESIGQDIGDAIRALKSQ